MLGCVQGFRSRLVPTHGHVQTMQPDNYTEGPGTVQDPHVPGTLKGDIGHVCLYGRQQEFRCLQEYRAHGLRDSGMACEVIFCNHAAHLVSKFPWILRQDLRV